MTTSMFSGIFAKAKVALAGNPRPAPAMPVVILTRPATPVAPAPQPISPLPKRPDLEDVRLGFRFGMQEVRIGLHATSEVAAKFSASLVGGR